MTTQSTTPFLLYAGGGVRISGASLPSITYLSVEHSLVQDTTSYPVESGAKIGDHAVRRPNRLNLEGFVGSLRYGNQVGVQVWEGLLSVADDHTLLTVATSYATYQDMLLRQAVLLEGTDAAARFRLEMEQILRVGVRQSLGVQRGVVAPAVADQVAAPVVMRVQLDPSGAAARSISPRTLTAAERIPGRAGD